MDDARILALYWQRQEQAVAETAKKYGRFCYSVAMNILSIHEDAAECVNDTWHNAWNAIPPERPVCLQAWLGRVVRNLALNRWNQNHAAKRYNGMEQLFDELVECIPAKQTVEQQMDDRELSMVIDTWLGNLAPEERAVFIRRYWKGDTVKQLAKECGVRPNDMAKRMYRLRQSLKAALEKEGILL